MNKFIEQFIYDHPVALYLAIIVIAAILLTLPFLAVTGFPQ